MQSLLLDLDDTLLPDGQIIEAALVAACAAFVQPSRVDPQTLARSVRLHARRLWYGSPLLPVGRRLGLRSGQLLIATFDAPEPALAQFRQWVPGFRRGAWSAALSEFDLPPNLIYALQERFVAERWRRCRPYPGVPELLTALRTKFRIAIVTNGPPDLQRSKIHRAGLSDLVDAIVISGELGRAKPDRQVFDAAIQALTGTHDKTVMAGDDVECDVAGAQAAGLRAIWVAHGQPLPPGLHPDASIDDVSALPLALTRLQRRPTAT